jgi:hypothetical protein
LDLYKTALDKSEGDNEQLKGELAAKVNECVVLVATVDGKHNKLLDALEEATELIKLKSVLTIQSFVRCVCWRRTCTNLARELAEERRRV